MPPNVLVQTMRTIQTVAPNIFRVRKYYGDGRRQISVAGEKSIQGNLTKNDEIFDGREANANTVVVCSYQTWNERNGPKGQNKWLRNKRKLSAEKIKEKEGQLDYTWPGALPKCFELAICDEAQELKSLHTKGNVGVMWLDADFHLLVTATPVSNGVYDFEGFMPFLQNRYAEEWWSSEYLEPLGLNDQINPYEDAYDDNETVSRLRITVSAARDYIFSRHVQPIIQGQRLAKIWQAVLIRRTNSSRIPFYSGQSIGESLPHVKSVILNCTHTEEEAQIYTEQEHMLTGALIDQSESRPKWSLNTHRSLTLLTMSLNLLGLDFEFDLKANKLKKVLQKSEFYSDWFVEARPLHHQLPAKPTHFDSDNPALLLQWLCFGAPKLRGLLRNIGAQVSLSVRGYIWKPSVASIE